MREKKADMKNNVPFSVFVPRAGIPARTTDSEFEFISRFFLLMQCQYIFFTACSVGRVTRKIYN